MRSAATVRAYEADWQAFTSWCAGRRARALPASARTVARHLDELATRRSLATVRRRLAAVRARHVDRGYASPSDSAPVRLAIARAEWRQRGRASPTVALGTDALRAMSLAAPDSPAGRRDRAVLLVGYAAGLRPAELTALRGADIRLVPAGLSLQLERGRVVVPFGSRPELCAVRAWKRWRADTGPGSGPAFRPVDRHSHVLAVSLGPKAIGRLVRRAATRAGLARDGYTGLSLRRGMVLAAGQRGVSDARIMAQTGHRSRRVVRDYRQERDRP